MHKKKAGKLQTGITFPKQYWLAVNGKPTTTNVGGLVITTGLNAPLSTGSGRVSMSVLWPTPWQRKNTIRSNIINLGIFVHLIIILITSLLFCGQTYNFSCIIKTK